MLPHLLLLLLLLLVASSTRAGPPAPPHWTVIPNADWPNNGGGPPGGTPGGVVCDSAECCADHCVKNAGCAAVSWNWKKQDGSPGDRACNFKCTDAEQNKTPGEQGVVVRKGQNFCKKPPPPPPAPPAVPVPTDWGMRMKQGSLYFYPTEIEYTDINTVYGNGAPLGNGFVGTKADAPSVFIGGVYSVMYEVGLEPTPPTWPAGTDPTWRANESARAHIPATVSSIGVAGNASGFAFAGAALDAERAVYMTRHTACGGKTVVERSSYAHRVHRGLLVTELKISGACSTELTIPLRSFADDPVINQTEDFNFHPQQQQQQQEALSESLPFVASLGKIKRPEHCNVCPGGEQGVCGAAPQVAVVRSEIPASISVPAHSAAEMSHLFVARYATDLPSSESMDSGAGDAAASDPLAAAQLAYR
jgi:hypothetical protein